MFKGVCPKCGSINNIKVLSLDTCKCVCNNCLYTDSSRVFTKIRVGDIVEIDSCKYLVRNDGLYFLQKQVFNSNRQSIKRVGDMESNPEFFYN